MLFWLLPLTKHRLKHSHTDRKGFQIPSCQQPQKRKAYGSDCHLTDTPSVYHHCLWRCYCCPTPSSGRWKMSPWNKTCCSDRSHTCIRPGSLSSQAFLTAPRIYTNTAVLLEQKRDQVQQSAVPLIWDYKQLIKACCASLLSTAPSFQLLFGKGVVTSLKKKKIPS